MFVNINEHKLMITSWTITCTLFINIIDKVSPSKYIVNVKNQLKPQKQYNVSWLSI